LIYTLPKLTEFMVSFGKVLPGESNFAKACEVYGSALVKVLPGESNFAKACEVYGSALAKFILIAYKK